jgi:phosphoribosylamine--glycine ligase
MENVVNALRKDGAEYKGTLYGQFMLTKEGPKVIEFNARFGDPEAMNVLSILNSDFSTICKKMAGGNISMKDVGFEEKSSVCKYVVPEGYGTKSLAGEEIRVDEQAIARDGALLYYASVNERDGRVYTTTSRSVGIVGIADSIEDSERMAENAIRHVSGRIHVRHDIAKKGMLDAKVRRMEDIRSGRI